LNFANPSLNASVLKLSFGEYITAIFALNHLGIEPFKTEDGFYDFVDIFGHNVWRLLNFL